MNKRLQASVLSDVKEPVNFDELEGGVFDSRTGNDNQFIKKIGNHDYLFNRVTIPAEQICDMVVAHDLNPRVQKFLNEISLSRLMKDILKTNGVQQPPVCTYVDGKYWALDGSRRTRASSLVGLPLVIEYTADRVDEEDALMYINATDSNEKIGRASCRERVCLYV